MNLSCNVCIIYSHNRLGEGLPEEDSHLVHLGEGLLRRAWMRASRGSAQPSADDVAHCGADGGVVCCP